MSKELNTLSLKKWVDDYSGVMPTLTGKKVGDIAIDTSTTPPTIWVCTDITTPVWVELGYATHLDNEKIYFGSANDASMAFDGTNLVIDPKEVGSGAVQVKGNVGIGTNTPLGVIHGVGQTQKWYATYNSANQYRHHLQFYFSGGVASENYLAFNISNGGTSDQVVPLYLTGDKHVHMGNDNGKLLLGAGADASITYDGTNLVIDPKEVGSGAVQIDGNLQMGTGNSISDKQYTVLGAASNAYEGLEFMGVYDTSKVIGSFQSWSNATVQSFFFSLNRAWDGSASQLLNDLSTKGAMIQLSSVDTALFRVYSYDADSTTLFERLKLSHAGTLTIPQVYNDTVGSTNRDLYIDNTGKFGYVSSSIRHKENVIDLNNTSWIYELRPVVFDYKDKEKGVQQTGLIAEEVAQINPDLVSYERVEEVIYESNGEKLKPEQVTSLSAQEKEECKKICYKESLTPETVNYSKLIVPMLKEIQNLKQEIVELKKQIATK